jgi:hypothetical protein
MVARLAMKLTSAERERITDSMLKIQSVRDSLNELNGGKIPNVDEIESCLDSADHQLKVALGYVRSESHPAGIHNAHLKEQTDFE